LQVNKNKFEVLQRDVRNEIDSEDYEPWKETARIFNYGGEVEAIDYKNHDRAIWMQMDEISAIVAISSSITKTYNWDVEISEAHPPLNKDYMIAFDLGHHQYGGRYGMSLEAVLRRLSQRANKFEGVSLSFWQYMNVNVSWARPKTWECKTKIMNKSLCHKGDSVSVFEVKVPLSK
jgi:hypothetical protein